MIRTTKFYYYFEEEDKKTFTDLLKANEINQEIFCKRFGISRTYLSLVLNGKRACPDFIHAILRKKGVLK